MVGQIKMLFWAQTHTSSRNHVLDGGPYIPKGRDILRGNIWTCPVVYSDSEGDSMRRCDLRGGPKKWGHILMIIILSNLNRFLKKFIGKFLDNFAVKRILQIPPHLAYVATLPCESLMSAKQALNDKLQGNIAAYFKCDGVVITKLRKVYCWVCKWKELKSVHINLAKLQARTWSSRSLSSSLAVFCPGAQ